MEFEEIRQRLEAVKNVRIQREAAENRIPGEGLRRKLRESFARQSVRKPRARPEVDGEPEDAKRS